MTHPAIKINEGFRARELDMAAKILDAKSNGKTSKMVDKYFGDIAEIGFNPNSGNVYAVDEDYNCAMMVDLELDLWLSSPHNGHEGFYSDLLEMDKSDWHADDIEWLSGYSD